MTTFRDALNEELENPVFKKAWDALEPEFQFIKEMLAEKEKRGMSQKDLAKAIGIDPANLSRIEMGERNPTMKTLKKIADGLDKKLYITFV